MVVIRPVETDDLPHLMNLASMTSFGLTTLPRDEKILARRIRESQRGFEKFEEDPPRGETFLFVMEDLETKAVIGTCGIYNKVGGFEPFYAYRVETVVHESKQLNIRKEIRVLHLVAEHNGPCEIGSLFLNPEHRNRGVGRLLSLSRFLFMAEHPSHFDPTVIAEMRGVIDERGRSAFWDALGKHFFDIDFPKADYLSILNKQFIADLMPRHPIYTPLLPEEAQLVIGQVHENTRPARKVLESEGFKFNNMVDIFEAGPVLSCPLIDIRAVSESVRTVVKSIDAGVQGADDYVIARVEGVYRACQGPLRIDEEGVHLSPAAAEALYVKRGDVIRYVAMKPAKSEAKKA